MTLRLRRRRMWGWAALLALAAAVFVLLDVQLIEPRIAVRWAATIDPAERTALERRYELRNGERDQGTTWRYDLLNRSSENIRALIGDPGVEDTGYIDRDRLTAPGRTVRLVRREAPETVVDTLARAPLLLQFHQSVWLLLSGGILLWAARRSTRDARRNVTVATLLLVGAIAYAVPLSPSLVRMGDATENSGDRGKFSEYAGVSLIRFEAHLSYAILGGLDRMFGTTDTSPRRAQEAFARGTTAWFVLSTLVIGALEQWSPLVVRYLALALLAPSALLYFGWLETGYHSLNVAAFPLIARGLQSGGWRLEAGSALTGLGAALHGFGVVSLFGAWLAALTARLRLRDRAGAVLRIAAWGTAAYVGWVALYIIILTLPIVPGSAETFPWRPWFTDEILENRRNVAIFSATGARDLLMTAWVVGAFLLVVAVSLWRQYGEEVRVALAYAIPSVVLTVMI